MMRPMGRLLIRLAAIAKLKATAPRPAMGGYGGCLLQRVGGERQGSQLPPKPPPEQTGPPPVGSHSKKCAAKPLPSREAALPATNSMTRVPAANVAGPTGPPRAEIANRAAAASRIPRAARRPMACSEVGSTPP